MLEMIVKAQRRIVHGVSDMSFVCAAVQEEAAVGRPASNRRHAQQHTLHPAAYGIAAETNAQDGSADVASDRSALRQPAGHSLTAAAMRCPLTCTRFAAP